jgi:hypothetical protein
MARVVGAQIIAATMPIIHRSQHVPGVMPPPSKKVRAKLAPVEPTPLRPTPRGPPRTRIVTTSQPLSQRRHRGLKERAVRPVG